MDSASGTTQVACPLKGCGLPIDVILRSSDGISFGGHVENLRVFSEGFCAMSHPYSSYIPVARYQETAEILRILLQFMHSEVPEDLDDLSFPVLEAVAEAAHKWVVYHAIPYCNLLMKQHLRQHPLEILAYTAKYNHPRLSSLASQIGFSFDPTKALEILGDSRTFQAWAAYRVDMRAQIITVLTSVSPILHKGAHRGCDDWYQFYAQLIRSVLASKFIFTSDKLKELITALSSQHKLQQCRHCAITISQWRVTFPAKSFVEHLKQKVYDSDVKEIIKREERQDKVNAVLSTEPPVVVHNDLRPRCPGWDQFYAAFMKQALGSNWKDLSVFDSIVKSTNGPVKDCITCVEVITKWRDMLSRVLTK